MAMRYAAAQGGCRMHCRSPSATIPRMKVPYGVVQPHCSFGQNTYEGHPWRLRDDHSGEALADYVGPEATLVLHDGPDARVQVLPGLVHVPQEQVVHPRWGLYKQRGEAMRIPIMAFDCVSQVGANRFALG